MSAEEFRGFSEVGGPGEGREAGGKSKNEKAGKVLTLPGEWGDLLIT